MLYAYKDNEKIEATPSQVAQCPDCEKDVISKCGSINMWHWAHKNDSECSFKCEPETPWHVWWKHQFPKECVEVCLKKEISGKIISKRTDMLTNKGVAVEFQHSPLSTDEVYDRELFYQKMVWIFDISDSIDRFELRNKTGYMTFRWKQPKKFMLSTNKPTFFDFGDGEMFMARKLYETGSGWGYMYSKDKLIKELGGSTTNAL